jgi:hypothetical protein
MKVIDHRRIPPFVYQQLILFSDVPISVIFAWLAAFSACIPSNIAGAYPDRLHTPPVLAAIQQVHIQTG